MRKLLVFNNVSLDGFFTDANGDMSWAHKSDPEWLAFTSENAGGTAEALFGRITYQMMSSWWPTPQAIQAFGAVANAMNSMPKVVFSRTLAEATWSNTRLVKSDPVTEVRRIKETAGPDLLVMGSGTIVSPLAQEGLIDELQLVIHPLVLGKGRTLFESVTKKLPLTLTKSRTFENGCVVLWYEPAR